MIIEFVGGPLDGDLLDVTPEQIPMGEYVLSALDPSVLAAIKNDIPDGVVTCFRGIYRQRNPRSFAFDWQGWQQ